MKATTAGSRRSIKSELVQARVDHETKRRLRSFADVEMLDESDIVRRAIMDYLNRRRGMSLAS